MTGVRRVEIASLKEFHGMPVEVFAETDGDGVFAGCVSVGNNTATFSAEERAGVHAVEDLIEALGELLGHMKEASPR